MQKNKSAKETPKNPKLRYEKPALKRLGNLRQITSFS